MAFLDAARAYGNAAQLAPDDPCIQNGWALTTALYLAIDQAEKRTRLEGRSEVELRNLPMPDLPNGWDQIIPYVREHLDRIAKIHVERTRRHARGRVFGAIGAGDGNGRRPANKVL